MHIQQSLQIIVIFTKKKANDRVDNFDIPNNNQSVMSHYAINVFKFMMKLI